MKEGDKMKRCKIIKECDKKKRGESEAKTILEKINQEELRFYDNNKEDNMPDLKYVDKELYCEVTHTEHNFDLPNRKPRHDIEESLRRTKEAEKALKRIQNKDYSGTKDEISKKTKKDIKLIIEVFGFDVSRGEYASNKERCDIPLIEHSIENIIKAIKVKNSKYENKNKEIELFIFATNDEFKNFSYSKDDCKRVFDVSKNSCFKKIYVVNFDIWNNVNPYLNSNKVLIFTKNNFTYKEIKD